MPLFSSPLVPDIQSKTETITTECPETITWGKFLNQTATIVGFSFVTNHCVPFLSQLSEHSFCTH